MSAPDDKRKRGPAVHVTDTALLAFIRLSGIADPDELRKHIALLPGVIPAAKMGRRNWTVDGLTFHFNTPPGASRPELSSVTSGPSTDLGGQQMARLRYRDAGNNNLGRRRKHLERKPKSDRRPQSPTNEGDFDD